MVIHCKIWLCGHGESVVYYVVCDLIEPCRACSWGLVDLTFCLASLLWPFAVAGLFGRCFDISYVVRPGHVEKFTLLISEINVDGTGEKSARW